MMFEPIQVYDSLFSMRLNSDGFKTIMYNVKVVIFYRFIYVLLSLRFGIFVILWLFCAYNMFVVNLCI